MKSPSKFLRDACRSAIWVVFRSRSGYAARGRCANESRLEALFAFYFAQTARGGLIFKVKLKERFNLFTQGRWDLIIASQQNDEDALKVSSRRRRTQQGDSSGERSRQGFGVGPDRSRHAMEGDIAPGNRQMLNALQDQERRPPVPKEILPACIVNSRSSNGD